MPMPPGPGMDTVSQGPPPAAPPGPPTFAGLAGQSPSPAGAPPNTGGMSQIGEAAVRMAMEIDQALKVLAQQIPQLLPWAQKTANELRMQLGQALNAGAVPTSPMPGGNDAAAFPDGGGRL